jgi:hypothetical protein
MQELLPLESLEVEVKQQCPSAHNVDKWDSERRVSSGICVSSSRKKIIIFLFQAGSNWISSAAQILE